MRGFGAVLCASLFLVACRGDGVDSAVQSPLHCTTNGGAPAPLTLAPFEAVTVSSAQLASCVTIPGNGSSYLVIGEFASVGIPANIVDWQIGTALVGAPAVAARAELRMAGDNRIRREFEGTLRRLEAKIAPRARADAIAARHDFSFAKSAIVQPPALGSTRDFKVVAALDGSSFSKATARLVYSGDHLLLYADTIGQGFSDAEFRALAAQMDRDLYAIDISAFGSVSDVDQDGHVIMLFTPKINALVPTSNCLFGGYVTAFFYGTDLVTGDPNSNKSEIIYSYIPDSAGVFGCPHAKVAVQQVIPGAFLHELQHMISFNQHALLRSGAQEEIWLNEGLGQIAEELGSEYYEAKFPAPAGRSTSTQIFPDSAGPFIQPQLLNAYVYLNSTRAHSVTTYNGGGSLEERGATWLFLRWLASQKGENIFARMVQTTHTGIANVENVSGEKFGALFGDFSVALYADSLPGVPRASVPARFRFGSRNIRALMAREATVEQFTSPFPLPVYVLGIGGALSSQMIPGTMVYSQIVPPSGGGNISLSFTGPGSAAFPVPLGAQVSIFRLPPQ